MAQQINRRPKGLQSLLDSKNLGVNPSGLSELASPIVQLDDLLYVDIPMQQATATAVITSAGTLTPTAFIDVPQGETWAVRAWGAYISTGAASTSPLSLGGAFVPVLGGGFVLAVSPSADPVVTAALDGSGFGNTYQRPLILTGGNRLCCVPLKVAGLVGNGIISHAVAYYPLTT